jgi:ferrous iron transport protein A
VATLDELPIAMRAWVTRVEGDDDLSVRLLEMGLTPGVEVCILGVAPLGDPIELEVRGYRLSVRRREAQRVQVNIEPAKSAM